MPEAVKRLIAEKNSILNRMGAAEAAIEEALDYLKSDAEVTPDQRIANARCALHEFTGDPRTPEFGIAG